jgi:hypothetical protein
VRSVTIACIAVAGCGVQVEYTQLNAAPLPMKSRAPESVEVYVGNAPARPHVDVGLLEVEEQSGFGPGTQALVDSLRDRAAEIGCDALVIGGVSSKVSEVESLLFDHNANRKALHASCVVYVPATSVPRSLVARPSSPPGTLPP